METVILTQDLEPLPKLEILHNKPMGILNSNYQSIVKQNFKNLKQHSIFGIKQRVNSRLYNTNLGIDAILKVSLFAIVFIIASL